MRARIFDPSLLSVAAALSCAVAPRAAVEVTLTTGDRAKLLSREADLHFGEPSAGAIATIDVDPSVSYQKMVGFGAALSDAAAWLIQNKLTPPRRESLLQELFGPDPGVGFSFVRVDMGASDFSLKHYSYADSADRTLANFAIEADRDATLPILKRALVINPQLTVMASPWSAPAWDEDEWKLDQRDAAPRRVRAVRGVLPQVHRCIWAQLGRVWGCCT